MTLQFWLKDRNDKYLRLPVNPPEISLDSPFGLERLEIAGLGEVSIPGFRGLQSVSFESFFPRDYNETYCEYPNFPSPQEWVTQLEGWRNTRQNIRLIITGTNISMPCYIESLQLMPERAGHVGDIYYNITFTQHQLPVVRKKGENRPSASNAVGKASGTNNTVRPSEKKESPKVYVVKKGDTLYQIAKRMYGKGADWQKLYNANKKVIGANANLIKPGQKLVIP